MDSKQAKKELEKIMTQKTVSISRLDKVLDVIFRDLEMERNGREEKIRRLEIRLSRLGSRIKKYKDRGC